MADRDYLADMDVLVTAMADEGTSTGQPSAVLGKRLYADLVAHDEELLVEYLLVVGVQVLTEAITKKRNSSRGAAYRNARHAGVAGLMDEAERTQDPQAIISHLRLLDTEFAVSANPAERKKLAAMNGADLAFVAGRYALTEKNARRYRMFLTAIGDVVGDARTTGEVFSEESLQAMWGEVCK